MTTVTMYGVYVKNTNSCLGMWYNKNVAERKAEKARQIAQWVEYEVRASKQPFIA